MPVHDQRDGVSPEGLVDSVGLSDGVPCVAAGFGAAGVDAASASVAEASGFGACASPVVAACCFWRRGWGSRLHAGTAISAEAAMATVKFTHFVLLILAGCKYRHAPR